MDESKFNSFEATDGVIVNIHEAFYVCLPIANSPIYRMKVARAWTTDDSEEEKNRCAGCAGELVAAGVLMYELKEVLLDGTWKLGGVSVQYGQPCALGYIQIAARKFVEMRRNN